MTFHGFTDHEMALMAEGKSHLTGFPQTTAPAFLVSAGEFVEMIRSLAGEALNYRQLRNRTSWKPMESAPKNQRILLKNAAGRVVVGVWDDDPEEGDWFVEGGEYTVHEPVSWMEVPA